MRWFLIALLIALTVHLITGASQAQLVTLGEEFQINTYTTTTQTAAGVAMDSVGNFTVTWRSRQDGSESVHGQRFTADGSRLGGEFQVNTYTSGDQTAPVIAMDPEGDFVIIWQSNPPDTFSWGIQGRRYGSDGNALGDEFQVNTYITDRQVEPAVAMDSAGNFVVVWQSHDQTGDDGDGIRGQRYASNGSPSGDEFRVNTYTTSAQRRPTVAANAGGDFVVAWEKYELGEYRHTVQAQRYSSDGSAIGGEFQISTTTEYSEQTADVAMTPAGQFVVVWDSSEPVAGYAYSIRGRRFDADGVALGEELAIEARTSNLLFAPEVAVADDGDFVVIWSAFGEDLSTFDVHGRRYSSDGSAVGERFLVNTYTQSNQGGPMVAMDRGDRFTVVWSSFGQDGSSDSIQGQRYAQGLIFLDGFESGDLSAWSASVP